MWYFEVPRTFRQSIHFNSFFFTITGCFFRVYSTSDYIVFDRLSIPNMQIKPDICRYTLLFSEWKSVKNSSFYMDKRKCWYFGKCHLLTYSFPSNYQPSAATHFRILPFTDLTTRLNNSVLIFNSFTWRVTTSLRSVRSVPGRIQKCVAADGWHFEGKE